MGTFLVERRDARAAEVEAAFAALDAGPGIYVGCDAGVPGLHPLQATLLANPSLAVAVHADRVEALPLDAAGTALAGRLPANAGPIDALRGFLKSLEGSADALLVGALRFDAHSLSRPRERAGVRDDEPLGWFYFSTSVLRRDGAGRWTQVSIGDPHPGPLPRAGEGARQDQANTGDDFPPGGYAKVVAAAVGELARGELVSLTLSQSFRRPLGDVSVRDAAAALRRANPAPVSFFLHTPDGERLFGASPDLQLVVRGRDVEALPVCGTVARGHGPLGEAKALRALLDEEVDAASLAVCSDALRNDLAPLCEPGSLALVDRRRPMALATVVHTVDRLRGRLRDGVDAWDAVVATAAPVMLTGTPRRAALAAIERFEASPRRWYGGMVVQVAANGDALVGTILRAAAVRDGMVEVRTGGDLLADSDPAREEHESRVKAVSLWRALGLAVDPALEATIARGPVVPSETNDPGASPDEIHRDAMEDRRVSLCDAGDPFAAAVGDALCGIGCALDAAAATTVLVGTDAATCARIAATTRPLVAIGEAAFYVLAQAGFAVRPIAPAHGRPARARFAAAAAHDRTFQVARYASVALDAASPLPPGWTATVVGDDERPLALVQAAERVACLLFRPESLLSESPALDALAAAIDAVSRAAR